MRWNCGGGAWNLEQSSDVEGPADSLEFIPDVPGMCKRNAWHLRVLRKLPSHPAHTSLPSRLWSAVLSLILLRAPADLPNSSPPPHSNPPPTLLPAELTKSKSVEPIYFFTWDLGSRPCPLNAEDAGALSRLPR